MQIIDPRSMSAWLKGFEYPFGMRDSEIFQRSCSVFLSPGLPKMAKSLEKTLFAFPSRIGASVSKAKERIAPAVDRPIRG